MLDATVHSEQTIEIVIKSLLYYIYEANSCRVVVVSVVAAVCQEWDSNKSNPISSSILSFALLYLIALSLD